MIFATAIVSICLFIGAFWFSGIFLITDEIIATTKNSISILRSNVLDEAYREKEIQLASILLLKMFFLILIRFVLILFISFIPIWLSSSIGYVTIYSVFQYMSHWEIVSFSILVTFVCYRTRLK